MSTLTGKSLIVLGLMFAACLQTVLLNKRFMTNLVSEAHAENPAACSQATVTGTFGFVGQGVVGVGTPQPVQSAEMGYATADGAGNLSGSVIFSANGVILVTPFTGSYDIAPNCTIFETISFGTQQRHQQGVIVDNGNEIDFIQTDPGSILTRVAKKVRKPDTQNF